MLTIWLENVTLKFQFLKAQLRNYYCQISHKTHNITTVICTWLILHFLSSSKNVQWKRKLWCAWKHLNEKWIYAIWKETGEKQPTWNRNHIQYLKQCSQFWKSNFWNFIFFHVELTYVCFELHMKVNIMQKSPRLGCTDSLEDTVPKRPLVSPSRPATSPNFYGLSANRYYSKFWSLKLNRCLTLMWLRWLWNDFKINFIVMSLLVKLQ